MPDNDKKLKEKLLELVNSVADTDDVTGADVLSLLSGLVDANPADGNRMPQRTVAADEDESSMAEAQTKADSAYAAIGKRAPPPFSGEKAMGYRKRVLEAIQSLTPKYREVNIRAVADSATLSVLEDQIYQAAARTVSDAMNNTKGYLHKQIRTDDAGRRIVEYRGDPNAWLNQFKFPAHRVAKFNTGGFR
ncbi:NUDIX hydrolase [Klebsiella aerogenes]|uniref:NUDIX hydrolase n=1 Tax=Klebsiella aerogenes TaxID=548 RepID=UPI001F1FC608|nr:NUDIX hydrolase [Klebsiella aerogenes]